METIRKGNATEAAVLRAFIKAGLPVWLPFGGGHAVDLHVDLPTGTILRVQCKCARPVGECLAFNSHSTDHGRGELPYLGRADLFGVYFPPNDRGYLVPVCDVGGSKVQLRLAPARNNQRRRVRMAADYEMCGWSLERLEAVADSRLRGAVHRAA